MLQISASSHAQLVELASAEQLLLRGNYAESQAAYQALLEELPVQAALGLSYCHWERGKLDKAQASLRRQLAKAKHPAPLHAQLAWLTLQAGDWSDCRKHAEQALALDDQNVQAAWVRAELLRSTGETEQAAPAFRELADRYDQTGRKSERPRELYWFGRALAQHARLNQDKSRFRQLTTELHPRILSLEPNFWPAHCETGRLLLEKFNASDAETAFNDALQINPQAADAHAGLARLALHEFQLDRVRRNVTRALKVNPSHIDALLCRADMHFAGLQPAKALTTLQEASKTNPHHSATLGRTSAAYSLLTRPGNDAHLADSNEVLHTALSHASQGEFYAAKGAAFEHARRYPQAGANLQRAIEVMPELLGPRGQLGMIEMRLGHEAKARELLQESFRRDPYNVRVKNQLEVLDLLDSYASRETAHFVIRYDPDHDEALADHMARYAEQCYDKLTATFDFELPEKALLEVFHDGQGIEARQWFGARMVGLPNIHTIAACGGNIVAMVSPTAERRKINWADILRHEIVHLINLQQTNYAVPHWLTEGCAVWQEHRPRRPAWEKLLVRRAPLGEVFNLDTINLGFLRPRSADDWQLAYCQAEMYVDLIARDHGVEGVRRLLGAYRDNLPPEEAIAESLGTAKSSVEASYVKHLSQVVDGLGRRQSLSDPPKLSELTERWEENPTDFDVGAQLALARLRRGDYPGAGQLARQVLEAQSDQPLARLVKAKLLARIGDEQAAQSELQGVVEGRSPLPEALKLLAGIHLRKGNFDAAKQLYQRGADAEPGELQWTKALAVVAIRQQDSDELNRLLVRIASAEPDNLVTRKKLLQLAQADEDQDQLQHWANEVLHIDPDDVPATRVLRTLAESNP